MRVFVAPDPDELDLLAEEGRDFTFTKAGELLVPPVLVCDGPKEHRERCGCGHSMTGVESMKGTSLVQVHELTRADVNRRLERSALVREWGGLDDSPGEFLNEMRATVMRVERAIRNAEGVPGDVFRVTNGPNDAPSFTIRRAK